ncbi:MAG: PAS domain S-box protein, partial [Nitrospinae bacterium]|nr:PAS domain S-box protein [Nitrospinota bacterium]
SLSQQASALSLALELITAENSVKQALRNSDRAGLLSEYTQVFDRMHTDNNLTHFYFLDKNRTCILRVHKPSKFNDKINRITAIEAEKTGKLASGIELGPLGTLTLRAVQPVFENGQLVGYVELGKEIEDVLQALHIASGVELAMVIRKKYLDRQSWEGGMRMLGREGDWDMMPRNALIYSSHGRLSEAFLSWADRTADDHIHSQTDKEVDLNGKNWRLSFSAMEDASGKELGDLFIMFDITQEKAVFIRLISICIASGAVLLALLLSAIYVLLYRTDAGIHAQQENLKESEEKFRNLFEKMVSGFALNKMVFDEQGHPVDYITIEVNDECLRILNSKKEDVVGKKAYATIPGLDRKWLDIFGEVERTGKPYSYLERIARLDKWVEGTLFRVNTGLVAGTFIDVTERRKAEEERQEALDRLDKIASRVPGVVYQFRARPDGSFCFPYASESLRDIAQVGPEEVREDAAKAFAAVHPDDLGPLMASVQASARDLTPWQIEFRLKRYDSEERWLFGNAIPEREADGGTLWHGVISDITERKKAEDALLRKTEELDHFFSTALDLLCIADTDGYFRRLNPEWGKTLGYTLDALQGKRFLDYVHPDDLTSTLQAISRLSEQNPIMDFTNRYRHQDGTYRWIEWRSMPAGKLIYAAARDITERKQMEDSLRRSAEDVRGLLDATEESMFLMKVGGEVIALNETAAKRFGKTPDEMVGGNIYDLMSPEVAHVRKQREAEVVKNRSPLTVEDERAGRYVRTTLWPVVDDKTGEVVRLAAFSIDITQRRKYEAEIQENRALLRRTLDSLMDAVFVIDADTVKIREINKAATDIFGYQADELIGKTTDFLHVSPESLDSFRKELYPAIEKEGHLHLYDFRMKRRDGSVFPTENNVFPLDDEQGRRVAWVSVVRDISKVKEVEERFRLLFNSGSDAIVVHPALEHGPGNIIEVNDTMCRRLGYSREELLKMSPLDFNDTSQSDYKEDMARVMAELKNGREVRFERVHVAKGGRRIPVEVNSRQFMLRGKPTVLSIIRDITERKKAEEAMRESENRFRLVADSAPVLIWMSGTDAKCNYFNKGWLDFTGRPLEDEMGDGWAQGVHPHDRERCVDMYMKSFNARKIFSMMYRLRRKDGAYRWVLDNGTPRFSSSGEFIGYIGSCFDITDRKEAEEAVARSEKKIREITSVIGQGVYALDSEGRLTFMNPEAERLLGWSEAELLGMDVHRRFHGKKEDGSTIQKCDCPAYKALSSGQTHLADGEPLTRKDGGMFPASIIASPMIDDSQVTGVVVAFSDITERQRIMRELTEAKERAEEATKLKDKFVSLVAHDLKSPFASIIGLLEVINDETVSERNRDIMTHVLQSGHRMIHMIDELLDISRLRTGKIKPAFRFFDASVVVTMALAHISQQAAGKGVALSNEIPAGSRLYADLNLFVEVLQNLLTNAVKFTSRGGVVRVFAPGNGIVAVQDTGVGIKKSFLPFLFRHEEKTTSPGTEGELGTGLGLPLSHDIMSAMGGDLTVESEEGRGSVFYANLSPVSPVALIVDDQAPVRYLLKQHLARIGINVLEAEDGEQALGILENERPNIVITDIMMPKMSGFDLLQAIKKNPETASTP